MVVNRCFRREFTAHYVVGVQSRHLHVCQSCVATPDRTQLGPTRAARLAEIRPSRRKLSGSFLSLLRRLTVLEFASWDLTASRLPAIKLDAIQVQQILLNLIRNASGSFTSQS